MVVWIALIPSNEKSDNNVSIDYKDIRVNNITLIDAYGDTVFVQVRRPDAISFYKKYNK